MICKWADRQNHSRNQNLPPASNVFAEQTSNHCLFTKRISAKSALKTPLWATLTDQKRDLKNPSDRPQISVSLSVSVSAILLNFRIGIGIADTFKDSIGIDYRPYFSRVSLTSLHKTKLKQPKHSLVHVHCTSFVSALVNPSRRYQNFLAPSGAQFSNSEK